MGGYKFCHKCGFELKQDNKLEISKITAENSQLRTFKNKGSWLMAKGQIACRISNSDLDNLDNLSGIVIQEGVTAIIYIDGHEVAKINGGIYNFVEDASISKISNERVVNNHSLKGMAVSVYRSLLKLVTGRKIVEGKNTEKIDENHRTVQDVIRFFNANSIISVYLKADRNFPVIFDMDSATGDFIPMKIRTKVLDAEFVVPMFMRINDFKAFIREYMPDNNSVTVADIYKSISPFVKNLLQRELQNEEIGEFGISLDSQERIVSRLKDLNTFLSGVEIVQILDITCNNEDFDRFRALTRELYCSEKELDYLIRTNEFKNRLASENIAHTLRESRSTLEAEKALDDINRDGLLNRSEMERFKAELFANDEKATLDIERFRMENMASLAKRKWEIEDEFYEIGQRKKKKELGNALEMEDIVRRHEYDKEIEEAGTKNAIIAESLKGQGLVDNYQDEREIKRYEMLMMKQNAALDALRKMEEVEEWKRDKEHSREMDITTLNHQARLQELRSDENLSDEKYFIKHGNLQGDAATVFAASFSAKHNAEQYKREAEEAKEREKKYAEEAWRREQVNDAKNEHYNLMMKELAEKGMDTISSVAVQRIDESRSLKDEYQQQLHHEQDRHDRHQETALNYTAKVTMNDFPREIRICPECGKEVNVKARFCEYCATKLL